MTALDKVNQQVWTGYIKDFGFEVDFGGGNKALAINQDEKYFFVDLKHKPEVRDFMHIMGLKYRILRITPGPITVIEAREDI